MRASEPAAAGNSPIENVTQHRIFSQPIIAGIIGNALEVFDFTSYAYFAVMIGYAFFPTHDPIVSLLLSLATFGVGFISRPLGGIVIGAYADRAGRRPAMMLSFLLMGVGCAALAFTPSYASIGAAAPIIVVAARLVQGFALGGEIGPATAFMLEAAPAGKRGLYGSLQFCSQGFATLASGLLGIVLSSHLSAAALNGWGWRVPFVVGIAILPIGLLLRSSLPETLHDANEPPASANFAQLMSSHGRIILLGLVAISSLTIPFYVLAYMTTYAITTLHMDTTVSLAATAVLGLCNIVFSPIGGALSDRIGRKPVMIWPRVVLALAAYPLFLSLNIFPTAVTIFAVTAILAILNQTSGAVALVTIAESLPRSARSASLGTVYALAVAIFGGTAQFVVTWLIAKTGDPLAPGWYLAGATAIGVVALAAMRETGTCNRPLTLR